MEAATRAKDEFVAMVSHELRTPLTAIIGWTRLLRSGTLPEDKRERALEVIERNGDAQNQLVSDLLDISRVATGRIRINPSQVDLATIVDIAVEDSRLALETKRLEVETELDRRHSVMRGDGDRLQQVVWNLLTNAIKYTPKDGRIYVRLRRIDSDLELVVRDTGIGIAPDFLPRVFESFTQSDMTLSRPHGGLGIGLSITKHLVDLHGGSIAVASEGLGKGATFTVRLPVSPLVSPTRGVHRVPAATAKPPSSTTMPELQGLHVLVTDDDPEARELLRVALEANGVDVVDAASADEALRELALRSFDLVISDLGMPGRDGCELIVAIRALGGERSAVPVIALTAFAQPEDRTRALVAGFNRFLTKPVELAELLAAAAELTNRRISPV